MPEGQFELEIPRGDNSLSSTPTGASSSTDSSINSENIPMATSGKNIFLEESKSPPPLNQSEVDEGTEEQENVSKYIRIFIVTSIITLIDIIIIGFLYSYNTYISQASKISPDSDKVSYIENYQKYLNDVTSLLGTNHTVEYTGIPLMTYDDYKHNFHNIVSTDDISYIQKRDILKEKLI
jgi:hypothetical protein